MKKKLFGNNIAPDCSYCEYGAKQSDGSFSCTRGKAVSEKGQCRAFRYDPLKREPKAAPRLPRYSPEEFTL